ncbi:MAG: DUF4173 domain-containing protein [Acidobacteriota bacterium]
MTDRTKTGLDILRTAAVMGLLGNILLRQTPWGLNAFLFVSVFAAALIVVTFRRRPELVSANFISLVAAISFFGSMFLFRDSIELRVFDTIAIIILMGVLILPNFGVNARIGGVIHYAGGFLWSALNSLFAPFLVIGADIEWNNLSGGRYRSYLFSVLRGVAIALPLVLIFGALLSAADAAFEGLVNRVVNFDLVNVISHVMLTSLFAWLTAGYLRGGLVVPIAAKEKAKDVSSPIPSSSEMVSAADPSFVQKVKDEPSEYEVSLPNNATILEHINRSDPPNQVEPAAEKKRDWQNFENTSFPRAFTLGSVEAVIILGLIDILFLSFVIIQVPYLFGGFDLVQNTPDLKLADYARRGFGELVAVAALVLPVLLSTHWLLRRDRKVNEKIYRVLAGIQIALLFVIMASAVQWLLLLTGEFGYGLTTVRFYPMVVMIWLAVVFIWFALTVLRGARNHFAWGALWAAIVILGATNLMNPDAFIARANLELAQHGRDFDAFYNTALSDDAVPIIVNSMSSLGGEDQYRIVNMLSIRYCRKLSEADIRSWNFSRAASGEALNVVQPFVESRGGCEKFWTNYED